MENNNSFDPDLIHAIFKLAWSKRALERDRNDDQGPEMLETDETAGASRKHRPTSANANALKASSEYLRIFVTEAVQRATIIAEAEGGTKIEPTHLERILPQLLLDF